MLCAGTTARQIAGFLMNVIWGGWKRVSQSGGAATPVSVSHSLAAPSLGGHSEWQKRSKMQRQTELCTHRGWQQQW